MQRNISLHEWTIFLVLHTSLRFNLSYKIYLIVPVLLRGASGNDNITALNYELRVTLRHEAFHGSYEIGAVFLNNSLSNVASIVQSHRFHALHRKYFDWFRTTWYCKIDFQPKILVESAHRKSPRWRLFDLTSLLWEWRRNQTELCHNVDWLVFMNLHQSNWDVSRNFGLREFSHYHQSLNFSIE